jgi:hypothetical protein
MYVCRGLYVRVWSGDTITRASYSLSTFYVRSYMIGNQSLELSGIMHFEFSYIFVSYMCNKRDTPKIHVHAWECM